MLHSSKRNSLGTRKVSPPQPTCMSPEQQASYLADLRTNRPARPSGSRPLPSRPLPRSNEDVPPRAESALSFRTAELRNDGAVATREQKLNHRASMPTSDSLGSLSSQKGRPLVPSPSATNTIGRRKVSPPQDLVYRESISRLKEKEEAHALREVLEKTDHDEDEERIHNAAKQEAADLVWKHRNPNLAEVEKTAAYRNPDLPQQKYRELRALKKPVSTAPAEVRQQSRSSSAESAASTDSKRHRLPWLKRRPKSDCASPVKDMTEKQKSSAASEAILQKGLRKISGKRQTSNGSSKGIFRNPEDEIYEEPEIMPVVIEGASKHDMPLKAKERNSLPRGSRPLPEKSQTDSVVETCRRSQLDIWKNEPAQSRNAAYTASRALPQTPVKSTEELEVEEKVRYKDGYEVRSDDIRAATSMKKSDRSPNLPTPTAVSDRLGRPIVSFDPKWKPGSDSPRTSQDVERPQARKEDGSMAYPIKPTPPVPEITIMEDPSGPACQKESAQSIPSIVVPSIGISRLEQVNEVRALPHIVLPGESPPVSRPSITIESERLSRPLPIVNAPTNGARPLPQHTQSSPSKLPASRPVRPEIASRVPWLARQPTATSTSSVTCTACTLPIAGRIVTASGSAATSQKARFHPECFTCHHCSTGLECVSFYPEPESARAERYHAEMAYLSPEDLQSVVRSNEDLRFFCHLDYHELYSPRCYTCKTPVEGAVILALGRHYHQDHFFCAECGDPFNSESPFVEHNSYPYCVSCHTRRTSARCRACKSPILNEMTVEALGGKWHEACFVCCDCGGDFGEEGRFFVREVQVEPTEKERRKGLGPKIEETAACQACEERRVKNVNIFI